MASKKNILDSFGWFLEKLKSNFVKKSGDTMTGPLTISKTEIKNNDAEPADKITVSLPKESGTLMLEPESVTKNTVYAGPSKSDGKPEFRELCNADLPETISKMEVQAMNLVVRNMQFEVDGETGNQTDISTECTIRFPETKSNTSIYLPNTDGTLALKSDIPNISLTGNNTFSGQNSFVSAWDGTNGKESISDYQLIIDMPTKENDPNYNSRDYYPAIWFRDKTFTGDYANKNTCCLVWNTVDNCFSMYDQVTGRVRDLAFEESIDALNAKIIMKKETVTGLGSGYIFLNTPKGYTIITAVNPNWGGYEYFVEGVSAYLGGSTILFFDKVIPTTTSFTVNSYWYKTS